ncbi:MAG TPA: GDP-L-fucose synthase [Paenibacillus sp.]|uniref:GDP-L-fucose synthase family protein n=1 Tax=Paenibacillus sp. TaxID=58172 RepID=UPI002BAB03A0|nr:GDP-L-fucose synthase [Paenibacillus sp.]HUC92016.1 GDP-L-fucose synthase [Paenibacillus sp.]
MNKDSKIYIAGHQGMIGQAFMRHFASSGYAQVITRDAEELDLHDRQAVRNFFESERPEYVILAAGKSGGIAANQKYPADFMFDNLQIQNNVIQSAFEYGVNKLLFIGRSCCYPKDCPQPMTEEQLLTGPLELTSEPFSIAKIAGMKMCESFNKQYGTYFLSVIPTNLYGLNDNFDPDSSHVLAALMKKIHEAKLGGLDQIEVWGTGKPLREFLYVDDFADACSFLLNQDSDISLINIGSGEEYTIADLAHQLQEVAGYNGGIRFDATKPDGAMRKLLDSSKLFDMGWRPKVAFRDGLKATYEWYLNQIR